MSPNGLYVAVIGSPHEVWGNYLAPLALWTTNVPHQLLYHRKDYVAHALTQDKQPVFLYWSNCGNWATFYEFKRQKTYEIAFVSLADGVTFKVSASDSLLQHLGEISSSDTNILAFLQQHNYSQSATPVEQVSSTMLQA